MYGLSVTDAIDVVLAIAYVSPIVLILAGGYAAKVPLILSFLRRKFFIVYMAEVVGNSLSRQVVLQKQIKLDKGPIPYIILKKKRYNIRDKAFFREGFGYRAIAFKEGNPNPQNIFDSNQMLGWDEAKLREAFNTRMLEQYMKSVYSKFELIVMVMVVLLIVLTFVSIYFGYQNQILLHSLSGTYNPPAYHGNVTIG